VEGTAYVSEGRFFRRGRDATSHGDDDEDPALTRALACEETRWVHGTWSPDRAVRDLHLHDVVVVLGGDPYLARMGDVAPGTRILFDGVVHETRVREGGIEARRTDVVLSEVVTTFIRDADTLVEIEVVATDGAAQSIVGTPEHPIFVPAREAFVPLGELRPGTILRTTDGGEAVVRRVRALTEGAPVYNIEVSHTHTYFAGGDALARGEVLVHNACDPKPPGAGAGGGGTTRFIDDVSVVSYGKEIARGTRDVGPTIRAIESGTLQPRNTFHNNIPQGSTSPPLPVRPANYYTEYEIVTPGFNGVGPERIVRRNGGELYYTPNHYETFIPLN